MCSKESDFRLTCPLLWVYYLLKGKINRENRVTFIAFLGISNVGRRSFDWRVFGLMFA